MGLQTLIMTRINVALIQQVHFFRKLLLNYIGEQSNIKVVHDAPNLSSCKDVEIGQVDILLLEISDQNKLILETLRKIKTKHPKIKILVMALRCHLDYFEEFLEVQVNGCVVLEDHPLELITAINSISKNEFYINPLYTEVILRTFHSIKMGGFKLKGKQLDERERQVLQLLWNEKSNKEIAKEIFLGIRSVEKIRQNLKDKLGIKSTIGLIKYGIQNDIIRIDMDNEFYKFKTLINSQQKEVISSLG